MKKLVFVLIALIVFNVQAQKKEASGDRANKSPEEMATSRTKQMSKALDLSEDQEKEVLTLNLKNAEVFGQFKGKKRSELSESERDEFRSKMKEVNADNKIALKEILTDEQYANWEKMQQERMNNSRNQRGNSNKKGGNSKKNKNQ